MLNWYKKMTMGVLHFLNYNKIGNENGSNHIFINILDLLIALIYAAISIWKLKSVTGLVLGMNLLTLIRLMLGNLKKSIHYRDEYENKYLKRPGLIYKSANDIKFMVECCVIAFLLVPFWIQGMIYEDYVIRSFAGTIIILSFLENVINVHVELFEASIVLE